MADDQDKSQKTEQPTEQRLRQAREKGQVAKSTEVGHWFMMVGTAAMLVYLVGHAGRMLYTDLTAFLASPDLIVLESESMQGLLADVALDIALAIGPIMGLLMVLAVVGTMVQHPIQFTAEKIKPDFKKISPLAGAKRLFSANSLVEFAKGIAKLLIVGIVAFSLVWPDVAALPQLVQIDPLGVLDFVRRESLQMVGGVLAVMTFIAGADFAYQKWKMNRDLMMSKQDIKDEMKQSEGDPVVKQRIRAIRMERARRRMIAEVPKAAVVIANPTHFAVALKYDMEAMAAPVCVAKGIDAVALKIREVAEQNGVPVVVNPPLARALHAVVDLEDEIPTEHYKAVAEVISYVMRLEQTYSGGRRRKAQ
ncbi:MAG: flagellar biosynthesis protein FlhB [Pseudomonadota bacterium]|nr:flagellar biosynthesis protein FlhB [Pseudomonadota bacterium]